MKILSILLATSIINTSLLSCKSRATTAQAKSDSSSTGAPRYTEQQKQALEYFNSLPDNEKSMVINKANGSTEVAAKMDYNELYAEFTRLSEKFYSKQGSQDFANTLADADPKNKNKRIAAGNEIYLYSAIRLRADKEHPTMKEDVYKALFERDNGKMLDINPTQFMDPRAWSVVGAGAMGAVISGLVMVTTGVNTVNYQNAASSEALKGVKMGSAMIFVGVLIMFVASTQLEPGAEQDK